MKAKAELKKTDDGYELNLWGECFQGLKKEIIREGQDAGIKYKFKKEGFDLITRAIAGAKSRNSGKASKKTTRSEQTKTQNNDDK